MVNNVCVNAARRRDLRPLADHEEKLRDFTKVEIREFQLFHFSLQLMFDQTLINI